VTSEGQTRTHTFRLAGHQFLTVYIFIKPTHRKGPNTTSKQLLVVPFDTTYTHPLSEAWKTIIQHHDTDMYEHKYKQQQPFKVQECDDVGEQSPPLDSPIGRNNIDPDEYRTRNHHQSSAVVGPCYSIDLLPFDILPTGDSSLSMLLGFTDTGQ
jgi:hypothetical protein